MKKILFSGGCGFLGGHVVDALLARGDEILDVDALTYAADPDRHRGRQNYDRLVLDCRRLHPDRIRKKGPFDAAIHLAAESHVDNSLGEAFEAMDVNIGGTIRVLEVARALEIPRTVIMSTDEVTGDVDPHFGPTDEQSPIRPSSPYSVSKAAAELSALAWNRSFGLPVVIARSTNVYGPYQHPEKFIPRCATKILSGGAAPLYGDGRHIRDWIHTSDFVGAFLAVLDRGAIGEVYCIGANNLQRNVDVVARIAEEFHGPVETVPDRPGHDLRYETDAGKVRNLGWLPAVPWDVGLSSTLRWYVQNRLWWEAAIRRGGRW